MAVSAHSVPLWLIPLCNSRCKEFLRNSDGGCSRDTQIIRSSPQPDSCFDALIKFWLPYDGPRFASHVDIVWRRIVRRSHFQSSAFYLRHQIFQDWNAFEFSI